jgi:hypothetical protein
LLPQIAAEFQLGTCTETFALSVALWDRCITSPKLTTLQRECYELPMACFLLAVKFSDGCPPRLEDLCGALQGVAANPRAVEVLEMAVLEALEWKVDTVTVTHLLLQAVLLLPAGLRETWRASMRPHVDACHVKGLTSDQKASTAAAAIIGIVAHTSGLTEECMASWLPAALTPPLDALASGAEGGGGVSARDRETLACMEELRRALPLALPQEAGRAAPLPWELGLVGAAGG